MNQDVDDLKIVLVEDSELLQEMVSEALASTAGAQLVGVADGQTNALEAIASSQPDLVIVDLELEEGDGLGVLKALCQDEDKYSAPQRVVFTNHTSNGLRTRCEAFGIDGYFDKSYQLDDLTDYVTELAARN